MKKILAGTAVLAAAVTFATPAHAETNPNRTWVTHQEGAWFYTNQAVDACLEKELVVFANTWRDAGGPSWDGFNDGAFTVVDTCTLTDEGHPTTLFSAYLRPASEALSVAGSLRSATYRRTETTVDMVTNQEVAVTVSVSWASTGPVERRQESERGEWGRFVRTSADAPARATFTVEAGTFAWAGSTDQAGISSSVTVQGP